MIPAGDEYSASLVILFQETVRFISGSSAVLGKGHSGKCPRIKGSFRAGERQEAGRISLDTVRQGMADWKESYWTLRLAGGSASAVDVNKFLKPLNFRLLWEREKEWVSFGLEQLAGG